jgi:hypothetical protein
MYRQTELENTVDEWFWWCSDLTNSDDCQVGHFDNRELKIILVG